MIWLRTVAAVLAGVGPLAGLVLWNLNGLSQDIRALQVDLATLGSDTDTRFDRLERTELPDLVDLIGETAARFDRLELMVVQGEIGSDIGRPPAPCPEGWSSNDATTWDSWPGGGRQFRICIRAAP